MIRYLSNSAILSGLDWPWR